MKAADLRKSILQAAVQGKLVPQNKNDEPASELLKRIQAEKAVLIKAGKLKKEKPLPLVTEDEIPYDLPEGWVWCRIGDVGNVRGGKRIPKGMSFTSIPTEHIYIRVTDMKNGTIVNHDTRYIDEDVFKLISKYTISKEDIYITIAGTIGNCGIIPEEFDGMNLTENAAKVSLNNVEKQYIVCVIDSPLVQNQFSEKTNQMAQPKLALERIATTLIPLPPLSEQQRIVAKVGELMALCDELEAAESELEALGNHFADYLPKSILQSAVQGKLVPQNKNDEPTSELLKRIQVEKSKLIKEGKLKKEKPLPPITEDEIPYDLPDGWVWCRLGNLGITNIGLTYKPSDVSSSGTPVLRSGNIQNGRIDLSDLLYVSCSVPQKLYTENGDILICARNGSKRLVGKSAIIQTDGMSFGAFMAIFRSAINPYVHKFLNSPIFMGQMHDNSSDTTTINQITQNMLKLALCPVPPLAEQHRIVAKVDELMALCDELKQVGVQPVDHSNVVALPVEADAQEEPLLMAAQGKVAEQPSKKHTAALDDLIGMMDDE